MNKVIFFAIISLFSMASCISVRFTNLDIQVPAQVTFPVEVVNIAIVNNIPEMDTPEESTKNIVRIPVDSLCNVFIDSLAYYLDKQQFFGQVVGWTHYNIPKNGESILKPLNAEQIQEISKDAQVEGLISVDLFQLDGSITKLDNPFSLITKELALSSTIILRSYKADGTEVQKPVFMKDTLYWVGSDAVSSFTLPSLDEAYIAAINHAVDRFINSYIPTWETVERAYFANGSGLMDKAAKFVVENKWQEAINTWEQAYREETNDAKRVRIAYNLALGNEAIDNIGKAITWIRAAKTSENSIKHSDIKEQIDWYYKELQKREVQSTTIKQQLGIIQTDEP